MKYNDLHKKLFKWDPEVREKARAEIEDTLLFDEFGIEKKVKPKKKAKIFLDVCYPNATASAQASEAPRCAATRSYLISAKPVQQVRPNSYQARIRAILLSDIANSAGMAAYGNAGTFTQGPVDLFNAPGFEDKGLEKVRATQAKLSTMTANAIAVADAGSRKNDVADQPRVNR